LKLDSETMKYIKLRIFIVNYGPLTDHKAAKKELNYRECAEEDYSSNNESMAIYENYQNANWTAYCLDDLSKAKLYGNSYGYKA
jgi:hypothetical protein